MPQPSDFPQTSLGEEQSTCHITHLSWSPAGLARYRRPVLAVLTSNHVLSIWEPTSNPRLAANWSRALIIADEASGDCQPQRQDAQEKERRRSPKSRKRAFAWSDACHVGATHIWGAPLLAVSDDADDITIGRLLSPYEFGPTWKFETLGQITVRSPDESSEEAQRQRTARARVQRLPTFATELAWSPWTGNEARARVSLLAYLARGHVYLRGVHVEGVEPASYGQDQSARAVVHIDRGMSVLSNLHGSSTARLMWHRNVWDRSVQDLALWALA